MSCTISALPFGLLYAVVSSIAYGIKTERESRETQKAISEKEIKDRINANLQENLQNPQSITQESIEKICNEYDTVFMDRDLLMKTLQEYGIQTLMVDKNKVEADVENFHLNFFRDDETTPFKLKVTCDQNCDDTAILHDLSSEYGLNAQEESYLKIKERLAQKNLQIDEEEVLEDNSIMLTINLN